MDQEQYEVKTQLSNLSNMITNVQTLNQEQHTALLDKIDHLSELMETKLNANIETQALVTKSLRDRVAKLEDVVQKVTWLVLSAVILAVVGLVLYPPKF